MRAFRIPAALVVVASVALVGCGDLGTAPSVDERGPEFRGGPTRDCPPGFSLQAPSGVAQEAVDHNDDGMICISNGRGGMADNVVPIIIIGGTS